MTKLIFIGTLHGGLTLNVELEEVLDLHKPSLLLVEMAQQDIDKKTMDSYPPEMVCAYRWARENSIPVLGFDSKINILVKGSTKKDSERLFNEQEEVIARHNWKDFNEEDYNSLLKTRSWNSVVDSKKWNMREEKLYQNIKKTCANQRKSVIITGSGHIPFFKKKFPKAEFPLE